MDVTVMAAAVLALSAVAGVAGLVPAMCGTRVNPVIALRHH
jgi:hypothetical protein